MRNTLSLSTWIRATGIGWILGIPLIVVFALLGEAIGIGGSQFLVGLGAGAGVGLLQSRALRDRTGSVWPWFWATTLGLSAPFAVVDGFRMAGSPLPYSLPACVVAGGLVAGLLQGWVLRRSGHASLPWALGSVVGWSLAAATTFGADVLRHARWLPGIGGALLYLGVIACGGLILGLVTGFVLPRVLRPA
jgi:hypothetical protein